MKRDEVINEAIEYLNIRLSNAKKSRSKKGVKYFGWQLNNCKTVHIKSYRDNPELNKIIIEFLKSYSPEQGSCHKNAYFLAKYNSDIDYVEGYYSFALNHAWNVYKKNYYFDITTEVIINNQLKEMSDETYENKDYLSVLELVLNILNNLVLETKMYDSYIPKYFQNNIWEPNTEQEFT